MQAYPAIGTLSRSPNGPFADASCLTKGWVNVSNHSAGLRLAARVWISRAAWMNAVYFVRQREDRFDPVRENWRMGRLIEELCCAMAARECPGLGPSAFTLSLVAVSTVCVRSNCPPHNFMCGLNTSMHRRKFRWTLPAATAAAGLAPSITEPEQSMSTTLTPARFTHRVP